MSLLNRDLAMLMGAQLVGVSGTVAMVTLGGIVGQRLAPTPALATLPLSCHIVGTAVSTVGAAWLMSRIGRPRGFAFGALVGSVGYLVAMAATGFGSFALFCVAVALVGAANAFALQYRFAAMEHAPKGRESQAISLVLVGSVGGAIVGPALAAQGEGWIEGVPFGGAFLVVAVGYVVVAGVLRRLSPQEAVDGVEAQAPRSLAVVMRQPLFLVAVLGGVAGFGVMTFVMTAAPLSMHVVDGHLPSLATGYLIGRLGIGRIMAIGALVLALTLLAGSLGREVMHYAVAMIALGVGWNFLYIGGTALLGHSHRPSERFRAQAVNEFSVFGVSACGSLGAGAVMHLAGWNGVLLAAALPIAIVLATLAAVRPQRRLAGA